MLLGLVDCYQHILDGIGWWNKPPDYGPPTPVGNIKTPTVFGVTSVKEPIYLLLLFLFVPCPCWFLIILGKLQKFVLKRNFTFTTLKPGTAALHLVNVVLLCFWDLVWRTCKEMISSHSFWTTTKKFPESLLSLLPTFKINCTDLLFLRCIAF